MQAGQRGLATDHTKPNLDELKSLNEQARKRAQKKKPEGQEEGSTKDKKRSKPQQKGHPVGLSRKE